VAHPLAKRVLATSILAALALGAGSSQSGCQSAQSANDMPYFDRTILPIFANSCSRQTTGCHQANAHGDAVGNLDTTSFDMLDRRRDLLTTYGPYSAPGILQKVIGPSPLTYFVPTLPKDAKTGAAAPITITTDIRHAAGAGIDVTTDGYATLSRWMNGGASRANVGDTTRVAQPSGACQNSIPANVPGWDPKAMPDANFGSFKSSVQPVLAKRCAAASCHGNQVADFSLTCGNSDDQIRWNEFIFSQFVSSDPAQVENSEVLRRPLDPQRGGSFHEGGVVFTDKSDPDWTALHDWVVARGPLVVDETDPSFIYFANRVQPMMVRKGCMFLGCHSPEMFHDLRLRGGSGGNFSLLATQRNYAMSRLLLAPESPDPNASRLIAKNLIPYDSDPSSIGARHRGGPLLDDISGLGHEPTLADCAKYDVEAGDLSTVPGYCIFAAWQQKERAAAIAAGPAGGGVNKNPIDAIVYVSRALNADVPQAFDTYRPGAALHLAQATMDATTGAVTVGADKDVTAGCGLDPATADIRHPAVSWDGTQIAFAARKGASSPLQIYVMKSDGSGCGLQTDIAAHDPAGGNGVLMHDFDPAWSPDGRLVFASTRGYAADTDVRDYAGPTLTPAAGLPNSNLYVLDAPKTIRQLSFYLNQELAPSFMRDGRVVYSMEKRTKDFYQLAGRRQNLDGGDAHPLFGQRVVGLGSVDTTGALNGLAPVSPLGALGYEQMYEVRELADRSFVGVFSDHDAVAGAGTLGVVNRSLGPDQTDRDPNDRFYLHSLTFPDPAATGKKGTAGGAYRSPSALPGRSLLASYQAGADVGTASGEYALVQVMLPDGTRNELVKVAGRAIVDAAAVYAKPYYGSVFTSRPDEANANTYVVSGQKDAELRVLDLPMLASLLFSNVRVGRYIDTQVQAVGVLEDLPPTTTPDKWDASFVANDAYGKVWQKRRRLGLAQVFPDGSLGMHLPGGVPLVLEVYHDPAAGGPIATQREAIQLYPGERARSSFQRGLFEAQCGGCHGSISGREVDVHLNPDVLTAASRVDAVTLGLIEVDPAPGSRAAPFGPN
jgi:hypothetical protein